MSTDVHDGSIFCYEPLERTKGSIRLLTIRPELSATGLIQCNIWHDTVDTTYTCLSYVWGSDLDAQKILINGSKLHIHMNLWQFLNVARKKYAITPRALWIDAICIDQTSYAERAHQVVQMGAIYSQANDVITWLGHSEVIERALMSGQAFATPYYQGRSHVLGQWRRKDRNFKERFRKDWYHVMSHPYWQRAWITQELLLARRLTFLVNQTEVDSERLKGVRPYMYGNREWVGPLFDRTERWDAASHRLKTYLHALHGHTNLLNAPLINLFHKLPDRLCKDLHDKVYALRAIASDAASIIVDYERPNNALIIQLLFLYKNATCACYLVYLLDTLVGHMEPEETRDIFANYAFTMRISPTSTEGFLKPDFSFSTRCPFCHNQIRDRGLADHIFCLAETCETLRGIHFRLFTHQSVTGDSYTLTTDDETCSQHPISVEVHGRHEYDIDWDAELDEDNDIEDPVPRQVYTIQLSARALAILLRRSDQGSKQPSVSRGLCENVRRGNGSMTFCDVGCMGSEG